MEEHILRNHAETDRNNEYNCEYCTYKTKSHDEFGKQYKEKHKPNNLEGNEDAPTEECTDLKEEVRVLKSNFEWLQVMYHQSLDELNTVKSEYEAKLIMVNDNYRVVKTETEVLKGKVDVLFKLGRSYLNNVENKKKNEVQREVEETENIESASVEDREETEEVENLQEWSKNKLRGFKRVNPTEPAKRQTTYSSTLKQTRAEVHPTPASATVSPANAALMVSPRSGQTARTAAAGHEATDTIRIAPNTNNSEAQENLYRGRHCHYFINKGKCSYDLKKEPVKDANMNTARLLCVTLAPVAPGINACTRIQTDKTKTRTLF